MYGIPLVDVPSLTVRFVRSAQPTAPVIEVERRRRLRSGRGARLTLGSRHG